MIPLHLCNMMLTFFHTALSVMFAIMYVDMFRAPASVCRTLPQGYAAAALLQAAAVLRGFTHSSQY